MSAGTTKETLLVRGYVSHSIRGRKGKDCSDEEMQANCIKAAHDMAAMYNLLSRANIPVELYVPGANDLFVQKAYKAGMLTEAQILQVDCEIISDCNFLLVYDWDNYISGGVKVEMEYAAKNNIPVFVLHGMGQKDFMALLSWLSALWVELSSKPNIIQFPEKK